MRINSIKYNNSHVDGLELELYYLCKDAISVVKDVKINPHGTSIKAKSKY